MAGDHHADACLMPDPIDGALLAQIATQHLYRRLPNTYQEAKRVFDTCQEVLMLYDIMQRRDTLDIAGSETRAKQILAKYLQQMWERKQHDFQL